MTTDTAARQPKGVPAGGQFAPTSHAEPSVALQTEALTKEQFAVLMTDELAGQIDASLKGRIRGKDWYSGARTDQVFESELDDDGIYIYTRKPSADEGVSYTVGFTDGKAQIALHNDYNPDFKPRDLHPERWTGPEDAAKEISDTILDMEGGASDAIASRGQSPDGFASDAEYRRWKER
ncbi:hypothetical protein [Arthrobacter sp. UYCo732]|uniref:hypothetical protein n=1 Tax=Arthrobacter sp. UYCo732 TaxID=3156336 RepID=UPI0033992D24